MVKTIKVDKVFENVAKTGKPWWKVVEVDGSFYSVWDAVVANQLPVGTEATVDYYEKNNFNTISKVVMVNGSSYTAAPPKAISKTELPEVQSIIGERIAAYAVAAQLISSGNGVYKDIEKLADSALAYYEKSAMLKTSSRKRT
jgi:hypothetical protein